MWEASLLHTNVKRDEKDSRFALHEGLLDSVYLLEYAADEGIHLHPSDIQTIVGAVKSGHSIWESDHAGSVLAAMSRVSRSTHPVTAASLRACRNNAKSTIRGYRAFALVLAFVAIPFSAFSFSYTGISNLISTNVAAANDQIVQLHQQLDEFPRSSSQDGSTPAPPLALQGLQQFAVNMRAIYNRTDQLNYLALLHKINDPLTEPAVWRFCPRPDSQPEQKQPEREQPEEQKCTPHELMEINSLALVGRLNALQDELLRMTAVYQKVRLYGKSVQEATSVYWGAISSCFLPVAYALLGACAYVIRTFSDRIRDKTFSHSLAPSARFIIAGISGMVIGLFSKFNEGTSLPPLAIAFLVGYATDVFFSFLEGAVPLPKAPPSPRERAEPASQPDRK
jgi:hypothetical protein